MISSNKPSATVSPQELAKEGTDYSSYLLFSETAVPELKGKDQVTPAQLLDYLVLIVTEASTTQFDSCQAIFFPGAAGNEAIDKVGAILDGVFGNVQETLHRTLDGLLLKGDKSVAFELLQVIESRRDQLGGEIPALEATLRALEAKTAEAGREFIRAELNAIHDFRATAKKRSGVFPYVVIFPVIERVLYCACANHVTFLHLEIRGSDGEQAGHNQG